VLFRSPKKKIAPDVTQKKVLLTAPAEGLLLNCS